MPIQKTDAKLWFKTKEEEVNIYNYIFHRRLMTIKC